MKMNSQSEKTGVDGADILNWIKVEGMEVVSLGYSLLPSEQKTTQHYLWISRGN